MNEQIEESNEAVNNKLTEWENEPTVANLKQDLSDASSDHDEQEIKIGGWLDNLNIEGAAKVKKITGKSSIVPKVIRKQAEWRYPSLSEPFLSTDDLFDINPVTFEDKEAAVQNGLILNNQFNTKIKKVDFVDDYVRAAVDEGTAIVRVGWDFEEEGQEVPVEKPTYAGSIEEAQWFLNQQVVTGAMQAQQAQSMLMSGKPIQVGVETVLELQMVTIKNQPTVEVCNYKNVIMDPTCMGDIDKASFLIYSFETNLSELKKDGKRYKNLDKINIENNTILGDPDHDTDDDSSFNFTDKPRKKFVAYEYWGFWDIEGTGIVQPFVATWVGNTMIRMEENPFPDQRIPFVIAQYLPVRRENYGEPDGELLEDNQKVIGAVTRGMIDIMGRSANGQVGSRRDALDTTNKRKFDRGQDYEYNAGVRPDDAFYMHVYPEIPQSAPLMLQMQNNEAESLTGVKAFSSGAGLTGAALGDSVGGIKSALDATAKRELGILRRLAEGVKQIGRKIIAMNAEFLSEEEVVRVTNDEFVTVRRDDLAGNFDLRLSISTAEADNDKAQELAFMLQTMGPNQDPEITKMIQVDIARLRKMPALAKQIEDYQPQPDPIAQEKAMLELELLKAQIYNEKAKGNENNANAQLDQAKAETEGAKIRNLESDSDQKDLDFVEQESGVNRQHDMDVKNFDRVTQAGLKKMDQRTNSGTAPARTPSV